MPGSDASTQARTAAVDVGSALLRLFPGGTDPFGLAGGVARGDPETRSVAPCPVFPTDLFAAAAFLLECSGAYQFIVAAADFDNHIGRELLYPGPTRPLEPKLSKEAVLIGYRWRTSTDSGYETWLSEITPIWRRLLESRNELLVAPTMARAETAPDWWAIAHRLLIIADEACSDLGYTQADDPHNWFNALIARALKESTKWENIRRSDAGGRDYRRVGHQSRHVALDSLCVYADRGVARVLPKARTAPLGCTMRTLSHNLALLPGHGGPNAYWHQPYPGAMRRSTDAARLNILLVPFPFIIPKNSFRGARNKTGEGRKWGRFCIDQKWLNREQRDCPPEKDVWSDAESRQSLVEFIDALIGKAQDEGAEVHGLIFPEYAFDWKTYDEIVRELASERPHLEFVVAGVSSDCTGRQGNLVVSSIFRRVGSGADSEIHVETHSRRKHHRWRLTRSQLSAYGLSRELSKDVIWWEYLEVEQRVLHVDVFRNGSTFTSVICEDIARVDPGMTMLRALGPNLVFALLMDGPQIPYRWPGAYAASLADDPGSSVLTLTSFGLVARSIAYLAESEPETKPSRAVALWKNYPNAPEKDEKSGAAIPMELDPGSYALLLRLKAETALEATLDERQNSDAIAWIYDKKRPHRQIILSEPEIDAGGWRWIVDGPT